MQIVLVFKRKMFGYSCSSNPNHQTRKEMEKKMNRYLRSRSIQVEMFVEKGASRSQETFLGFIPKDPDFFDPNLEEAEIETGKYLKGSVGYFTKSDPVSGIRTFLSGNNIRTDGTWLRMDRNGKSKDVYIRVCN